VDDLHRDAKVLLLGESGKRKEERDLLKRVNNLKIDTAAAFLSSFHFPLSTK
jgi:hypothetical protein